MVSSLRVFRSKFCMQLNLLCLIMLITFGDAYKLWSSSLCSLLQPLATSSLYVQTLPSAPCSQTPSVYFLPLQFWTERRKHSLNLICPYFLREGNSFPDQNSVRISHVQYVCHTPRLLPSCCFPKSATYRPQRSISVKQNDRTRLGVTTWHGAGLSHAARTAEHCRV
jgi:hypothetical protein